MNAERSTTTDLLGLGLFLCDDEPARWAREFVSTLAQGREVPLYGSQAWQAEQDYRLQVAAAVRAGEVWRRHGVALPRLLADDLAAQDHRALSELAEAFGDAARHLAGSPTHAELVARRAVVPPRRSVVIA